MARAMVILLGLALLAAGCSQPADEEPDGPGGGSDEGVPHGPQDEEEPMAEDPAPAATETNLTFDYASEAYSEELVRYAVVARANTTVDVEARFGLYPNGFDPGCVVFSVQRPAQPAAGPDTNASGAYFVGWEGDADVYLDVRSTGGSQTIVPDQFDDQRAGGVLYTASYEDRYPLTAGRVLLIEVGGSGPHLFEPAASGDRPYAHATFDIRGDAVIVPLPPAPLRCGVGARETTGGTGVSTYLLDVEHGGRLAMATGNGSTVIVSESNEDMSGSLTLDFLGQEQDALGGVARSAAEGGEIGITFDEWVAMKGPGWLFAETHWPMLD